MVRLIGQGEAGQIIFAETDSQGRIVPMTEQPSWERLEEALRTIRQKRPLDSHKLYYSFSDGVLALENTNHIVGGLSVCDLPAAILELRDLVDLPKPKEREWRERDVVHVEARNDGMAGYYLVGKISKPGGETIYWTPMGTLNKELCRIGHERFKNRTIEAEQASEKE